jgi:hypothetical protein
MSRINGVGRSRGYHPIEGGGFVYVHMYKKQWWWRATDENKTPVGQRMGPFTDSDAAAADANRNV